MTTAAPTPDVHKEQLTSDSHEIEDLKHHDDPKAPPTAPAEQAVSSPKRGLTTSSSFIARLRRPDGKGDQHPLDWGRPGELSKEEVKVFVDFRKIVETRDGDFRDTIYSFGEEEGEPFALCRWLRARKFNLDEVVKMVEEATKCRADAKSNDFYPDPNETLGVEPYIYVSQYPQLYSGVDKNGCPVFISKPGILNVAGISCITKLNGILKFHWHAMMHDFSDRLKAQKKADPDNFTRFECTTILDLDGLSTSAVTKLALRIVQEQSQIDSLCFPETLSRMVIINAPRIFSVTWKLIKGWLDPRTISKVDLISSRSSWEKKLKELIDEDQLPSDYGGKAEDTRTTLMKDAPSGMKRLFTKQFALRTHDSVVVELNPSETMEVVVFTRSEAGATFSVEDADKKKGVFAQKVLVKHTGGQSLEDDLPTSVFVVKDLQGPCKFKIKAVSLGGRFSSENFLVVCKIA